MGLNPKIKATLSSIGSFLSTFLITLVAIVAIALVLIKLLGWSVFSIDSYSMSPKYPLNSLIVVQTADPATITSGDVITFSINEEGTLVTHRVVSVDAQHKTFTTKGDANSDNDPAPVMWANVVGKVFLGIPFIGAPLRVITAPQNRVIVIAVIASMFLLSVVWEVLSAKRKRKQQQAYIGKHAKPASPYAEGRRFS